MRNMLIVIGLMIVVAIFSGLYVVLFSPYGSPAGSYPTSLVAGNSKTAVAVSFTPLAHGMKSAVTTRVNYLITSANDLAKLWGLTDATGTPPNVDFSTHSVIAVFAGQQPFISSTIAISNIQDTSSRVVSITIAKPDGSCAQKTATTTPYEIVSIPTTSLPLVHQDISTTIGCS